MTNENIDVKQLNEGKPNNFNDKELNTKEMEFKRFRLSITTLRIVLVYNMYVQLDSLVCLRYLCVFLPIVYESVRNIFLKINIVT